MAEAESVTSFSNECLKAACQRHHHDLITSFDCADSLIISYLFSQGVLSIYAVEELQAIANKIKLCELLMVKLHQSHNNAAFICFHRGLQRSETYTWLADNIEKWCRAELVPQPVPVPAPAEPVPQPVPELEPVAGPVPVSVPDQTRLGGKQQTFKEAFKGKKVALRDSLEVTNKLLKSLVDKGVLIDHHERKIRQINDEPEKVDALLDILERREDSLLNIFCDELNAEGQAHAVRIIRS